MSDPLVAFVTALPLEAGAVRKVLAIDWHIAATASVSVSRGVLPVGSKQVEVALVITGHGNVTAASVMRELIAEWPDTYFVFVGIAGGRHEELRHGDVVVADYVYNPMQGKEDEHGFHPRSSAPALTRVMHELVAQVIAAGEWAQRATRVDATAPRAFLKPIASSEIVDAAERTQLELRLEAHHDDAYAVETEGFGFLSELAAQSRRGVLVRGISDMRADKSGSADKVKQPVVAEIAAAFARELVVTGITTGVMAGPALSTAANRLVAVVHAAGEVPVPVECVAAALATPSIEPATLVEEARRSGALEIRAQDGVALGRATGTAGQADPPKSDIAAAVEALIRSLDSTKTCRLYLTAAVALARLQLTTDPAAALHFFDRVEGPAKRSGSLRLVLDAARISTSAACRRPRSTDEVKAEAKALICGTSWVYQRTGRLHEALADGVRSLELGAEVGWDRNTYYCDKCLGRLHRMRAETATADERRDHLHQSIERLQRAIVGFGGLEEFGPGHAEVGDCHSLLARTYFVVGDRDQARAHADIAAILLADSGGKDALDLEILQAELDASDGDSRNAAQRLLPIIGLPVDTLERSEIVVRALIVLSRVAADDGDAARADQLLAQAGAIAESEDLQLAGAMIVCEREALRPTLSADVRDALSAEAPRVRAAAIRLFGEDQAKYAPAAVARHRSRVERSYVDSLRLRARAAAAAEDLQW